MVTSAGWPEPGTGLSELFLQRQGVWRQPGKELGLPTWFLYPGRSRPRGLATHMSVFVTVMKRSKAPTLRTASSLQMKNEAVPGLSLVEAYPNLEVDLWPA